MTDKPTTLKEAIAAREADRVASNLTNLATAYVMLGEEIGRLQAIQADIDALGARDPATITYEETRALYDRAHGRAGR